MCEQIEGDVTGAIDTQAPVVALECWDVWCVCMAHLEWEQLRHCHSEDEADALFLRLGTDGEQARIVHYTLPALTIKAEEAE